jgi:hypothetical protein
MSDEDKTPKVEPKPAPPVAPPDWKGQKSENPADRKIR